MYQVKNTNKYNFTQNMATFKADIEEEFLIGIKSSTLKEMGLVVNQDDDFVWWFLNGIDVEKIA